MSVKIRLHDGGSRSDAALVGGVARQIVRDWVLRFDAEGPEGFATRKAPGPPSPPEMRRLNGFPLLAGKVPTVAVRQQGGVCSPQYYPAMMLLEVNDPRGCFGAGIGVK